MEKKYCPKNKTANVSIAKIGFLKVNKIPVHIPMEGKDDLHLDVGSPSVMKIGS